ncbi:MAG: retroviral-like aspartic protease family protein [Bacteroidetes bacterium]|nr:retroviral-like aspartic protease family protein [Bacteroidota bacterium]
MRTTYPFEWLHDDGLIIVHVEINGESILPFLLDTGSSDTYLDKNILYIEQINLKDSLGQVEVETANGRMFADVFKIESIDVFGTQFKNYPIQIIDFIANGIISNYSGILGMDIIRQKNLCLHFDKKTLTFS